MNHQDFLFELLSTPSPTGAEQPGQKIWTSQVRPFADRIENDAYGNTWATLDGGKEGPRLMLEAHADEIGFMIRYISDEGFIYVNAVGGSDVAITRGRRIRILGDKGEVVGIIGNTATHLRRDNIGDEKAPKWHEVFVDIGASNRDEVVARGLRVGHFAVYDQEPVRLDDHRLSSRAIDNRISGYLLARVLEELRRDRDCVPAATVYAVNAVQEEVGGNGATMVTYRLKPDLALVFDVTHATDTPGLDLKKFGQVKLGAGPSITHGVSNHPAVVQRLMEVAGREGIPLQHESSSRYTGTDTDNVFVSRSGVPAALVSIPLRYMHSPVELVDMRDVEHAVRLVVAFVHDLKPGERFGYGLPE